jgi:hypothetical protein
MVFASAMVTLALMVAPARAITGEFVEDFEHPFVGLAVFYDANGEFSHRCSGSLLTPVVFLTAGHGVVGVSTARVYFQQDAGANFNPETGIDPITGYPEDCFTQPCTTSDQLFSYGVPFASFPNTRDVGLVSWTSPFTWRSTASSRPPGRSTAWTPGAANKTSALPSAATA